MRKAWIRTAAPGLISVLLLGGCASTKDAVLPQDNNSMHQIYEEHFEQIGEQRADHVRKTLQRRPGSGEANLHGYTREAQNEIRAMFPRLPNPTLVMFVFPHLAGPEGVAVPGYATSFPMYERVEYALPGEAPGTRSK
ncbi:MAG: TIGR03751 family conjugal transfer lipoprotein [Gammaproteobacteria bacterium]|nr:TIGR03751 family conjugal transfer lipoprotein [Gammaproteobacteria bacterium]